jgi:ABC-type molybdate transport system substrate-binding protein
MLSIHQSRVAQTFRGACFFLGIYGVFTSAVGYDHAQAQERLTGTLTVFAAASLTEPFTEIGRRFEAAHLQTISIKSLSIQSPAPKRLGI